MHLINVEKKPCLGGFEPSTKNQRRDKTEKKNEQIVQKTNVNRIFERLKKLKFLI